MKKRAISLLLVLIFALSTLSLTALADGSLSNFSVAHTYTQGQFSDVSDQWFAPYVQAAYEYGLVNGKTATTFAPASNLTIAEAIKLAVCLHSIYNTGTANFTNGSPWYRPYVDYALTNGIITAEYGNYNANATRAEFAVIFANALPDEALTKINTIDNNAIPDVSISYSYGPAVYKLYRAGILTGSDSAGTFYPSSSIRRDAVAAIAARMADASLRQSLTLTLETLTEDEITELCTSAVFYIELHSKTGSYIGSGSGFFINDTGLAVTNYHVIEDVLGATATTTDGQIHDIIGVYDYSIENDLALIQVDGTGFNYLNVANSDFTATGDTIYTIGYPGGVGPTMTSGTITNSSHYEDGTNYIMIDAAIAPGSSGGALINAYGKVIGVTSAAYVEGQNLNLAVPINLTKSLSTQSHVTLESLFARDFTYYTDYPSIPDFGAYTGIDIDNEYMVSTSSASIHYIYYPADESDAEDVMIDYINLLIMEGFEYAGDELYEGFYYYYFIDPPGNLAVSVGLYSENDVLYYEIGIMSASLLDT